MPSPWASARLWMKLIRPRTHRNHHLNVESRQSCSSVHRLNRSGPSQISSELESGALMIAPASSARPCHRSVLELHNTSPTPPSAAALREQVAAPICGLDLVADGVRERHLDHLAREVGPLRSPVAERLIGIRAPSCRRVPCAAARWSSPCWTVRPRPGSREHEVVAVFAAESSSSSTARR